MNNLLIRRVFRKSSAILTANFIVLFIASVVDGTIISCFLGAESMAAFQLALPVNMFVLMANQIFISGNKNLCAAKMGSGKIDEAKTLFSSTIAALLMVGIFCSVFVLSFSGRISEILGASGDFENLKSGVAGYITGCAFGMVFFCIGPAFSDRLYLAGNQKVIIIPLIIQTLADIIGNILSITIFHAGLFGVGFATSLSYLLSFVSLLIIDSKCDIPFKFSLKSFALRAVRKLFFNGLPEAAGYCWLASQNYILNMILISVGTSFDISILSYIGLLGQILCPFTLATSTSAFTLAGIFNEDNDNESLKILTSTALKDSFIINILIAVAAFIFAPYIVKFWGLQPDENKILLSVLRITIWYFPIRAVNATAKKILHGTGMLNITYVISFLEDLFLICSCAAILGFTFGSRGIWISYMAAEILTAIFIVAYVMFKNHKLSFRLEDFVILPKTAGDYEFFDRTAQSSDEVLEISHYAEKFCMNNGASSNESHLAALAIEELGGNLVKWGFGKKQKSIDIRIFRKDSWILRIRDDCSAFNPKDWLKIHSEKNLEHNGIRMVCSLAKDVNYFSVLGFNNLIIKI